MKLTPCLALLLVASPARADHPGARLDEVMAKKEPAFEKTDRRLPAGNLLEMGGAELNLEALPNKIIVLSFVPDACGAPCAEQQALLADAQAAVNITPTRRMVAFVTVASAEIPAVAGWSNENWRRATAAQGSTSDVAAVFAKLSRRAGDAPMIHIIDRGSRHAAIFHGASYDRASVVLYLNGLTNSPPPQPEDIFERMLDVFQ